MLAPLPGLDPRAGAFRMLLDAVQMPPRSAPPTLLPGENIEEPLQLPWLPSDKKPKLVFASRRISAMSAATPTRPGARG